MAEAVAQGGLRRFVNVRPGEGRALALAFAYFFCLLASYYILRPVRDEMAVRSGVGSLSWLFTGAFVVSLLIAPIFAALVSHLRRSVFIPVVYGFLVLNILAFWVLLTAGIALETTARVFFIWLTVYVVFAVSVFWSFMADLFDSEEAKRLFPVIAAGGSLGAFAGSAAVTGLARVVGPANLLLIAAMLLSLALLFAVQVGASRRGREAAKTAKVEQAVGGGWLTGLVTLFRSFYLGGIGFWVVMLTIGNGVAYYLQTDIMGNSGLDSATRTSIFGAIDLTTNILQPLIQILVTRWMLIRVGVGITLGVLALVFCIGFLAIFAWPVLGVLIALQIAQRTGQFAISNPARETLWTAVSREDKYKAKNVVDNAVFRGSDAAVAWAIKALNAGAGLSFPVIALMAAPLMAGWFVLSLALGRSQGRRAAALNPDSGGDRHDA